MDQEPRSLFGRPAFAALLAGLGLALLAPPLLASPAMAGGAVLWLYLFAAWAGIILLIAAAARARRPGSRAAAPPGRREIP